MQTGSTTAGSPNALPLADAVAPLEEVASAMGKPPAWLKRNWLKLHLAHGMPRRHAAAWVWPRALVFAWLQSGGSAFAGATSNDNAATPRAITIHATRCAAATQALRNRYGAQA